MGIDSNEIPHHRLLTASLQNPHPLKHHRPAKCPSQSQAQVLAPLLLPALSQPPSDQVSKETMRCRDSEAAGVGAPRDLAFLLDGRMFNARGEELSLVDAAAAAARPGGVIDCGQSALAVRRLVTLHQLSLVHVVVRVQSRAEANKCMNPLGCVLEIAFA